MRQNLTLPLRLFARPWVPRGPTQFPGGFKAVRKPSGVSGPYSLATGGGQQIPAEILILANGFKTQSLITPMKIQERDWALI
ncbi:hypothetical protein BDV10DRAFT_107697 [Aspergillus recurvatus]